MHPSPLIIKKRIFPKIVLDIGNTYYYTYIIKKRQALKGKEDCMKKLMAQAITEMGCCVYVELKVSDDYTMNEVVREVKRMRFVKFRIVDTMKVFAEVK